MRSFTRFRAIFLVLSFMCCLPLFPLKAAGSSTVLTVHVPETHILFLEIRGSGNVKLEDTLYTHSVDIEVARLSELQLLVTPADNSYIHSLLLNGEPQSITGNSCTLEIPSLTEDLSLEVVFRRHSIIPATGDWIFIPMGAMLLSGIFLIPVSKARKQ